MGRGTGQARTPEVRGLRLTPEAELDLDETHAWYHGQGAGLGGEFLRAVNACLALVRREPEAYQLVGRKMRRSLLRRFPYAVFFEVSRTEIVVYAVFHSARNPRAWRRRRGA